MKKFTFIAVTLLVTVTSFAQTKFWVYNNDGTQTEFLITKVDSISFSEPLIVDSQSREGITVAIIVAMDSEFDLMKQTLSNITVDMPGYCVGRLGDKRIVLQKCGIGKVNAALTAAKIISTEHPDYIINSGVAGGMDRSVAQGDIVVGVNTTYHDLDIEGDVASQSDLGFPAYIPADAGQLAHIKEITSSDSNVKYGLICTGDQFITNNDALTVIKNKYPEGLAVDMESNSIAHVCYLSGIPFISIRIISDTPWVEYQAEQYAAFWQSAPQKLFSIVSEIIK